MIRAARVARREAASLDVKRRLFPGSPSTTVGGRSQLSETDGRSGSFFTRRVRRRESPRIPRLGSHELVDEVAGRDQGEADHERDDADDAQRQVRLVSRAQRARDVVLHLAARALQLGFGVSLKPA